MNRPAEFDTEGGYDYYMGSAESISAKINLSSTYMVMEDHHNRLHEAVLKEILRLDDEAQRT